MPLFIYEDLVEKNVKIIASHTRRKIMAVVKSDAYGLSTKKMIPLLKKTNIDFFVFETYSEYLKCQNLLRDKRVLILESTPISLMQNAPNNVAFSMNSIIDAIKVKDIQNKITIHLRVDTGMNRQGIRNVEELKKILTLFKTNENILVEGLYTHFSSDVFESKYYEKQLENFKKYQKIGHFSIVHANATKSLNKELVGNYVRVGMALYGYHQPYLSLQRSVSLIETPCSVFKVSKKDRIGYNQIRVGNEVVGVLPIGYNDVNLDGMTNIYQKGQKYALIGKSCMNHTHFLADDKINYLSWLSILPTNGIIIDSNDYNYNLNWYHILTSLKGMPKNYIRRRNYDIPKIFKYNGEKSFRTKFREGSNQTFSFRIIQNGWCNFFCETK